MCRQRLIIISNYVLLHTAFLHNVSIKFTYQETNRFYILFNQHNQYKLLVQYLIFMLVFATGFHFNVTAHKPKQRTRIQLFHVIPQETVNVKTVNHKVLHNIHLPASPIAFIAVCPTLHGQITHSLSTMRRLNVRTRCPCEIKTAQCTTMRVNVR